MSKISFSPEFVLALARELDQKFNALRISKIEGGESWIALKCEDWLLFSWGARNSGICRVSQSEVAALKKSAPARTPLVEFLKSQLLKGQLTAARQIQNDRVFEIECSRFVGAGFANKRFIILEATEPNGNFFLLDESHEILELARHVSPDENQYRTLLPGHIYSPPPPFKGFQIGDLKPFEYEKVGNIRGIGRPLAELIMNHWNERTPDEWFTAINDTLNNCTCLYQSTKKGCITSFPIVFEETEQLGSEALNAARPIAISLLRIARNRLLSAANKAIDRAVKSRERHIDGLIKQLERRESADELKLTGQLLIENAGRIPPRAENVELESWDEKKLSIRLDPMLSAVQNAERYFKKYRKAQIDACRFEEVKNECESLRRAASELSEQKEMLAAIDDISQLEEAAEDILEWLFPSKTKKQKKAQPPHLRFDIGEAIILVGLNARGNRFVTFKQAGANDLWLHAHEMPGAHVIIKGNADDNAVNFAASLAAFYSKGKNSLRVAVDCTQKRNVRSIPGSSIAHVTYTNPRVINADPHYWKNQEAETN